MKHQQSGGFVLALAAFNELRGAKVHEWAKVMGGAAAIVAGACLLAYTTQHHSGNAPQRATPGILAALSAGVLWGTMYIPYRKAYISGMNPLSFVTIFTVGELGTTFTTFRTLSLPKTQSTTRSGLFTGGVKASTGVTERARAPDLMAVRTCGKSVC